MNSLEAPPQRLRRSRSMLFPLCFWWTCGKMSWVTWCIPNSPKQRENHEAPNWSCHEQGTVKQQNACEREPLLAQEQWLSPTFGDSDMSEIHITADMPDIERSRSSLHWFLGPFEASAPRGSRGERWPNVILRMSGSMNHK